MSISVPRYKAQLEPLPLGNLPEDKQFHSQANTTFLSTSYTSFLKVKSVDYGHQPGMAIQTADFQALPQNY